MNRPRSLNETPAGSTTTFKNWSAEGTMYLCLKDLRFQEILDHVKIQTSLTSDESYIDARLAEEGLHDDEGLR
eukprot:5007750-Amphidinium_carterae.1